MPMKFGVPPEPAKARGRLSGLFAAKPAGEAPTEPVGMPVQGLRTCNVQVHVEPLIEPLPWASIRHRARFAVRPWGVIISLGIAGYALHDQGSPDAAVALAGVLAVLVAWRVAPRWLDRPDREGNDGKPELVARRRRYATECTAIAAGWLTAATAFGTDPWSSTGAAVVVTVLLTVGPFLAAPYWQHYRVRADIPVMDPAERKRIEACWEYGVAVPGGALPGTMLIDIRPVAGGWRATIVSAPGSIDPELFRKASGRIAGAYETGPESVAVEVVSGNASRATLMVQKSNPLVAEQFWPGPIPGWWDLDTGLAHIMAYGDGELARYRMWGPAGAWMDLIAGCTGSGKSELVNLLLALELNSHGLVLSRIIDPQWGQSFGDLQDAVDWFAPNIEEARVLLRSTVQEMYRRNRTYGRTTWTDGHGRNRRGQKTWAPTVDEPLISVTIDEAHEVLKDRECRDLVAQIAKMGRKCGIKIRLITQVPILKELGDSAAIRDSVAAGNVIVFRTANASSAKAAFVGNIPGDPARIPKEWPDGSTTAGLGYVSGSATRPAIARACYRRDIFDVLADRDGNWTTTPGVLSPEAREAAGDAYRDRVARVEGLGESAPLIPETAMAGDGTATEQLLARFGTEVDGRLNRKQAAAALVGYSPRTVTNALAKLVEDGTIVRVAEGVYDLTDSGREALTITASDTASEDEGVEE